MAQNCWTDTKCFECIIVAQNCSTDAVKSIMIIVGHIFYSQSFKNMTCRVQCFFFFFLLFYDFLIPINRNKNSDFLPPIWNSAMNASHTNIIPNDSCIYFFAITWCSKFSISWIKSMGANFIFKINVFIWEIMAMKGLLRFNNHCWNMMQKPFIIPHPKSQGWPLITHFVGRSTTTIIYIYIYIYIYILVGNPCNARDLTYL